MKWIDAGAAALFFVLAGVQPVLSGVATTEPPSPPPPPLSQDCQTPGVNISGVVTLPNVQRALKDTRVIKIMTIGASSSAFKRNSGDGYYQVIEGVLEKTIPGVDIQIIDRGVSGELARDAGDRLKSEVALTNPNLVLWQVGSADALAQVRLEEFEATLDETVDWLKGHGVDVVLVGVQYVRSLATDPLYQAIRTAIVRVADRHQVLRIGRYEAMQVIEQGRQVRTGEAFNQFAATEQGHTCLSEYVVRAITSGIFVRPIRPR
jgi:hypothetical protein